MRIHLQAFIIVHGQYRQGRTVANRYDKDRAENIQGQAWVGDRQTLSRGLGRENNPGTCKNQDTGNLTRDTGNTGNLTRDTGNTGNLTRETGKRFVHSLANNTRQRARESPEFI